MHVRLHGQQRCGDHAAMRLLHASTHAEHQQNRCVKITLHTCSALRLYLPRRSDWFACVLEARNSLGHKDYRMSTFNTAITHPVPVCNVNQVAVLTTGVGFLQGSLALDI